MTLITKIKWISYNPAFATWPPNLSNIASTTTVKMLSTSSLTPIPPSYANTPLSKISEANVYPP